jgi:hypothetical protein
MNVVEECLISFVKKTFGGANEITQATLACILTTFVTTYWEILLKYSWNIFFKSFKMFFSYYFINVYVKILAKCHFQKKKFYLQVLLLSKNKHYNV